MAGNGVEIPDELQTMQDGLETEPAWSHKPNDVGSIPTPAPNFTARACGINLVSSLFYIKPNQWSGHKAGKKVVRIQPCEPNFTIPTIVKVALPSVHKRLAREDFKTALMRSLSLLAMRG